MNHAPLLTIARALAECLVSHPKDLRFEFAESHKQVTLTICGHRDDTGKLMGRDCKHAKAIEAVLQLLTERETKIARVNIAEGWTGEKGATRPEPGELFENATIRRLGAVCRELFNPLKIEKVGTSTHLTLTVVVAVSPRPELEPCLQTVFKAFGGMNNRFVTIEVVEGENESVAA